MTAPSLAELQHVVWKLLTAPEGVEPGIQDLVKRGVLGPRQAGEWFAGDERLGPSGRLDVYANMYFYRLRDSLAEDFSRTASILGAARFHNLITDFLLVHPSAHPSLRFLGGPLPEFLDHHPYGSEMPYLADLALLEWTRNEIFQALNSPVLSPALLAALPTEKWAEIRFIPVAAVRLLRLDWDVVSLWERLEAGGDAGEPVRTPRSVLVFREDDEVHHEALSTAEADIVALLLSRKPFGEICEELAGEDDVEAAASRAASLVQNWMEHALLSGIAFD